MSEVQSYRPVASPRDFLEGFTRIPRRRGSRLLNESQREHVARHEARVASAAELFADLLSGRAPAYFLREAIVPSTPETARLIESNYPGIFRSARAQEVGWRSLPIQEAMSVSDFPLLMGDVMDRTMLTRFSEVPQVWREYISVGAPLRDFRTVRMLSTEGGNEAWEEIADLEGIKYTAITESEHTLEPALYGMAIRLSWRLMMNDDLDALRMVPDHLAQGGRRTLNQFATDLLFDANGPDATVFSAGNGNLITGNPALSTTSLGTAFAQLLAMTDDSGMPINIEGVRLIYPPGLHVTVQNILNTLSYDATVNGAGANTTIRVNNWLTTGITPVMDPYIPAVVTGTPANAATSWILAANPASNRPLARIRFLQGFEAPVMYQKAPNTQRVGGGLDADVGDFQSMASEFKGLIAFGGAVIEPRSGVASQGDGS